MVRQKIPDDNFKLVCTKLGAVELFLKSINSNGLTTLSRNKNRDAAVSNGFFGDLDYKNAVSSALKTIL